MERKSTVSQGQSPHNLEQLPATSSIYRFSFPLLIIVAITVFMAEALITILLSSLPPFPVWLESFIDSSSLIILVFPSLYFFFLRPLNHFIHERRILDYRTRHLTAVLQAIRNVNQLITREKDRDHLLKGICERLIATRGYYNAWIALFDENGSLTTTSEAGLGDDFIPMKDLLNSRGVGACRQKVMEQAGVQVIDDPATTCVQCPLAQKYAGRSGMRIRLEYGGKAYGILTVSIPRGLASDKEEQGLFEEVAGDVAFALYNMEVEREHHRAVNALRQSEERYRHLVEESFDGIFIQKGPRIIFANQRLHEMLGYEKGELLDLDHWLVYHREYQEVTRERARARMRGEDIISQYEVKLQRKDGSWFWGEVGALVINVEGEPGIQVWVKDITERKRVEEIQRVAEKKYRGIFENALEGIFQSTLEGRFITVNPALARIYGYDSPEELMENIRDIGDQLYVNPALREEFIRHVLEEGYVKRFEVEAYRKDGSTAITSVDAYAVRDEEGKINHIEGFIEDISMLKHEEEERKRLQAQYEQAQKMEAIGTLAGGIAHDFNNILQAILGYTEILLMGKRSEDPDYEKLMHIQGAAQRASELVQRILTFSRKVESELRPVDLNLEVSQTQKLLRRTIPRMIDIELYLQEDLKLINADPAQVEQVIMNISVNARDAMPEGGRLVFETQNVILNEEYCRSHLGAVPGEYVLLSISDTGHGMDREILGHIFEPFYTTKETGEGTGLGLAMVYGIVKSHGGYIMCYSEPGEGTTFKIYFPVVKEEILDQMEWRGRKEIRGGNETIVLVDDDKDILDIGKEMLEHFGYRVITARSGEETIEIFSKAQSAERISAPDLVILDLSMPGMGGQSCLEKLLKIDPGMKVIIASGYSANGRAKDAIESGAIAFIQKPYQLADMLQTVRSVLDR